MHEIGFKKAIRRIVGGWWEAYEPRSGGGMGVPDLQYMNDGFLIPVEAKLGWLENGLLRSKEIRGVQIGWHEMFRRAGGQSLVIVGVPAGKKWDGYVLRTVEREYLMRWKAGWPIGECMQIVRNGKFEPGRFEWPCPLR